MELENSKIVPGQSATLMTERKSWPKDRVSMKTDSKIVPGGRVIKEKDADLGGKTFIEKGAEPRDGTNRWLKERQRGLTELSSLRRRQTERSERLSAERALIGRGRGPRERALMQRGSLLAENLPRDRGLAQKLVFRRDTELVKKDFIQREGPQSPCASANTENKSSLLSDLIQRENPQSPCASAVAEHEGETGGCRFTERDKEQKDMASQHNKSVQKEPNELQTNGKSKKGGGENEEIAEEQIQFQVCSLLFMCSINDLHISMTAERVYMCTYIHTYIHTDTHINTKKWIYTRICMHTYMHMYACMNTCKRAKHTCFTYEKHCVFFGVYTLIFMYAHHDVNVC
jgi:hypothetical protein